MPHEFYGQVDQSDLQAFTPPRMAPVTNRMSVNSHVPGNPAGGDNIARPDRQPAVVSTSATRCRYGRLRHRMTQDGVTELELEYRNAYVQVSGTATGPAPGGPNETDGPSTYQLRASVTLPGGPAVPVTFPNADPAGRVTLTPGAVTYGRVVLPRLLAAGATIEVGTLVITPAVGATWISGSDLYPGDYGADYAADPTGGGSDPITNPPGGTSPLPAVTATAATPLPCPAVVRGNGPDTRTLVVVGDSIPQGYDDQPDGIDGGGWVTRLCERIPFYDAATGGERTYNLTPGRANWRLSLIEQAHAAICTLTGNDLILGASLATLQARCVALWSRLAQRCPNLHAVTLAPMTARISTGTGWTPANQTVFNSVIGGTTGLNGTWGQYNAWIRDGAPLTVAGATVRAGHPHHPLAGWLDVAAPVTDPGTGWKWPQAYVSDGVHMTPAGHAAVAAALAPALPLIRSRHPTRPVVPPAKRKCILRKSANQTIPASIDTVATWDVVDIDEGEMRAGNTIVVPPGTYWIAAQVRFAPSTTGNERVGYICANYPGSGNPSAYVLTGLVQAPLAGGAGNLLTFGRAYHVTAATTLSVVVWENGAGPLEMSASAFGGSTFSVTELP